jgi:RNA polymerase sigma-70 factor (ECF subfamily)
VRSPEEGDGEAMQKPGRESIRLATFDQYRGLLFSIAYRMLGSVADAGDMVQEAFIRWRSPRAFLVTIISRLCMNQLQSARARREEYVGERLPEPLVTDAGSDPFGIIRVDESLSMAFVILLERLTAVERAVFLLREVFEYEYSEIAAILGQNEANCRQILRRARQHVDAARPRFKWCFAPTAAGGRSRCRSPSAGPATSHGRYWLQFKSGCPKMWCRAWRK